MLPLATKLGRVWLYHKELPPIKPHDLLITWYCEVIWQIECYISTCRRPHNTKLRKVLFYLRKSHPWSHVNLSPRDQIRDHATNWRNIYLHFHKTYGYYTWQISDSSEEVWNTEVNTNFLLRLHVTQKAF